MLDYEQRAESVVEAAQSYDDAMCRETLPSIYQFGEGVLEGSDLTIDAHQIQIPGFGQPVSLDLPNPYSDPTS